MSVMLRTALIIISALTLWYTARKIRKSQLQIEDSIFWLVFPAALVVLSIFPILPAGQQINWAFNHRFNFIFLAVIFILIVKAFSLSLRLSQMDTKIRTLTQEIAIRECLENEKKTKSQRNKGERGVMQ